MIPDVSRLCERFGGLSVFLNEFSCNLENHLKKHIFNRARIVICTPDFLPADIP